MAITTDQTELSIVNAMLSCIGDLPVEDLELDIVTSDADVIKARNKLKDIMRQEQTIGWWFNTETIEYTPDETTGYIELPANLIRIKGSTQYVNRNGNLYDMTNRTLVIDVDTVELDVVLLFDFMYLPYSFFNYMKATAKYEFFLQEDGDLQQLQNLSREVRTALMLVQDEDMQFKAPNMLTGNPTVQAIMNDLTNRRD